MVALDGRHRPLVGGISVMPLTGPEHRGTLTCVARRKSDNAKVLVTNLHVASTDSWHVNGDEVLYQGDNSEFLYQPGVSVLDRVGQLYTETVNGKEQKSWIPVVHTPEDAVAGEHNHNLVDVAAFLVTDNVEVDDLKFQLHNHPNHDRKPIIKGTVKPRLNDVVHSIGVISGETMGTVKSLRATARVRGANLIDAAYFIPSVGADFGLYKEPSHTTRHVLTGAVNPVEDDANPMELLVGWRLRRRGYGQRNGHRREMEVIRR